MLVASFGPTTAWVGKTITWDGNQFVLEGHGSIPAAVLVGYDQQGHLQWASAELRSWAWAYARWEAGGAPPAQAAAQAQAVAQPQAAAPPWAAAQPAAAGRPAGGKKPFPVWAIVLIVAAVVILAGGLFAAIFIPASVFNDQHVKANESAVTAGVHSIQVGIQTWAVDHQGQYPAASDMNQMTMSDYVDRWPTNPYTGAPMAQSTQAGDYFYEVSPDGTGFRLVGYGEGGKTVIEIGSAGSSI